MYYTSIHKQHFKKGIKLKGTESMHSVYKMKMKQHNSKIMKLLAFVRKKKFSKKATPTPTPIKR